MNKLVAILIFLVCSISFGFAQSFGNHVMSFDNEVQQKVELEGYGSYGSNALDIKTMQLFYGGGYFDEDLKNESYNRLSVKNTFGGEYGFRIGYEQPYVSWLDSAGIYLNYELNGAAGIAFTEDLFRLVFDGNEGYSNDSALFSGTEFSSFAYRKIGLGYIRTSEEAQHKLGLSFLTFDNYTYGLVDRGLYVDDANSDTLRMRVSGNWMTDTRENKGTAIGFGVGVDYEAKLFPVANDSTSAPMLICGVRNLGVFFSSKQMNIMALDTTYVYAGYEINNISDFSSDLFPQSFDQDTLLPQFQEQRKFRVLPFELYFYSPSDPNGKKLQLIYGMRYRYGVAMIPQIYLGGDWRPNQKTIVSTYLSFGGYSYFKTGLAIRKQFGKTKVGLVFNNVPGFITKEAYQQSLAISLSYGIK